MTPTLSTARRQAHPAATFSRSSCRAVHARRAIALTTLALAFVLLGASSALAITRPQVLARAQSWVDHPVSYSQSKFHLGYRTDCSGYVSMCWATGQSYCTASFHEVTHPIAAAALKPGDAMLKAGYHIRLFHNWADSSHTRYVAYEAGRMVAVARIHSLADDLHAGYVPSRYDGILDGPAIDNLVWNGSFDAWDSNWGDRATPAMWSVANPDADYGLAQRRTDTAHTSGSSLELRNPADYPKAYTTLSQEASITGGGRYVLAGWFKTADADALDFSVHFLSRDGAEVGRTTLAGSNSQLTEDAFAPMSACTTAPANACSAVIEVRLATGNGYDGTDAIVDDVSLVRARAKVSAKADAWKVRRPGTVTLSGTITPSAGATVTAGVSILPPGKRTWRLIARVPVAGASAGGSAAWTLPYRFAAGTKRGAYKFRVSVPGFNGLAGATSGAVTVRLQ